MSISAISSNTSLPQTAPVAQHHHKKAASVKSDGTNPASQESATPGTSNGSANYHGVSGASGRVDTFA